MLTRPKKYITTGQTDDESWPGRKGKLLEFSLIKPSCKCIKYYVECNNKRLFKSQNQAEAVDSHANLAKQLNYLTGGWGNLYI